MATVGRQTMTVKRSDWYENNRPELEAHEVLDGIASLGETDVCLCGHGREEHTTTIGSHKKEWKCIWYQCDCRGFLTRDPYARPP